MKEEVLTFLCIGALLGACNQSKFKGNDAKLHPLVTKEFVQDDYDSATTTIIQGFSGEPVDENFEQGEWGALDILVVIDNSPSMAEEQQNLGTKLDPLLSRVSKSDWQIAVVTTDPNDGCQRALVRRSDPDAKERFLAAVTAGTSGSGLERGIGQAVAGLDCAGHQWLRAGSTVVVLIVTDEDNCFYDTDSGYGCTFAPDRNGAYLTTALSAKRTVGKDAKVYGLLWHPSTPTTQCATAHKSGDTYADVIAATGGTWGSICDKDYTTTLEAISHDISQILKYEFELADMPDQGTLQITVDGQPWTKFLLSGRQVKFTEAPPFGSKVGVAYRHGAEGELLEHFKLEKPVVEGTLAIKINGVEVPSDQFTWQAGENSVTFATTPEDRAEVAMVYQVKNELKTRFEIGLAADPNSIEAVVDGRRVTAFTYDTKTGEVVFAEPPPAKASVKVSFRDL